MRFQKGEVEDPSMPLAPMIDIVFQLLIFFMCATTFSQLQSEADVKLPVAEHSQKKETEHNELVINVRADGTIVLNQIVYTPEELVRVLVEGKAQFGMPSVFIRADKTVPHGKVLSVLGACARADIWDVSVATYKEEPMGLPGV